MAAIAQLEEIKIAAPAVWGYNRQHILSRQDPHGHQQTPATEQSS